MLKDYYNILELPPHASVPEIKQAFRRMAMIYHPDKNVNDPYAAARFNDVKEAYEVLTNPARKESYLQERWYNQSIGKKRTGEAVTPVSILKLCIELEKYVSTLDVHRMNKEGLSAYITDLLSDDTIGKLKEFKEEGITRQIITIVLNAMKPLPLKYMRPLIDRLKTLARDEESGQRIRNFLSERKKKHLWEKYKIVVMLLFTILLCLLIYLTSK
ncbi:MAG TPA: DnaJ domain-containing protein [Chitinophagaceae bacterium]|nr:DnaJ domain-containing protein [Chitinophagaceae bacterium]